jgi:hypothetical protein
VGMSGGPPWCQGVQMLCHVISRSVPALFTLCDLCLCDVCACLQVGDSISCAVYDVEAGGVPLLTQRLPEEADDELAELADEMDQVGSGGSCVFGSCLGVEGLQFRVLGSGWGRRVEVEGWGAGLGFSLPQPSSHWLGVARVAFGTADVWRRAAACAVCAALLTCFARAAAAPVPVLLRLLRLLLLHVLHRFKTLMRSVMRC